MVLVFGEGRRGHSFPEELSVAFFKFLIYNTKIITKLHIFHFDM